MSNSKFIDNFFKLLFLLFWPIIWYNYVVPNFSAETFIFISFTILSIFYVIVLLYNHKKIDNIIVLYRISNLIAFVFFLCSYLLFSKSIILLIIKFIFIFLYFYISCIRNFRYNDPEGVVGILSSLLLLTITLYF